MLPGSMINLYLGNGLCMVPSARRARSRTHRAHPQSFRSLTAGTIARLRTSVMILNKGFLPRERLIFLADGNPKVLSK